MAEIILARSAGFCFGVERAVDMVYEQIKKGGNIYTYGPIIHNENVVDDLASKGVRIIDGIKDIEGHEPGTVIIRSHGVERVVYEALEKNNMSVVDATCPFVLKIHRIVEEACLNGEQVVIIGSGDHPEVQGIMGYCDPPALVIDTPEKARDFYSENKNLRIVSQTTFQYNKFKQLVEILLKKGYNGNISNTICNATEVRQKEAREIAKKADAMIVIGGSNSSNTRKLYEISAQECKDTVLIGGVDELETEKLKSAHRIGITAGASTPNNIIQEVYTSVRREFCGLITEE